MFVTALVVDLDDSVVYTAKFGIRDDGVLPATEGAIASCRFFSSTFLLFLQL